ncbi:hypothetical protein TNCV_278831 [Trichonephila clavipes]|nr:hypothetical protein TNCV_278831 [Trichonephila clavipes]
MRIAEQHKHMEVITQQLYVATSLREVASRRCLVGIKTHHSMLLVSSHLLSSLSALLPRQDEQSDDEH